MMAGKLQSIKDGDDVRRCLWVAEGKFEDILHEIKKHKSSIEISGPIKNLKYFWVSGKKEVIQKICRDCTKHSMSTDDPITNKDDIALIRCLPQEPLNIQWKLGITLNCHFILFRDDSDVSAKATDIIKKLGEKDNHYTQSVITYDIKLIQATPTWEYTVQGGTVETPLKLEQRCINASIDINSFRSDCNFICPDKVHDDIDAVLKEVWPNCNIIIQEVPPT